MLGGMKQCEKLSQRRSNRNANSEEMLARIRELEDRPDGEEQVYFTLF